MIFDNSDSIVYCKVVKRHFGQYRGIAAIRLDIANGGSVPQSGPEQRDDVCLLATRGEAAGGPSLRASPARTGRRGAFSVGALGWGGWP